MNVFLSEYLPFHHEHFEHGNRATQDWCGLARHGLLDMVRNLLAQLHQDMSKTLHATYTQNDLDIFQHVPVMRRDLVLAQFTTIIGGAEEVIDSLLR